MEEPERRLAHISLKKKEEILTEWDAEGESQLVNASLISQVPFLGSYPFVAQHAIDVALAV